MNQTCSELRRYLQHLSLLRTVNLRIASAVDPGEVLANLLDAVDQLVTYEAAAVYLLDLSGEALETVDGPRLLNTKKGHPVLRAGRAATTGMPHSVLGIRAAEEGAVMAALNAQQTTARVNSEGNLELAVPLLAGGRALGALELQCIGPLSEAEVQLLELLAASGAMALRSADLCRETRRLATTDALTGLSNHRHFHELLRLEAKRARRLGYPVAVAMLTVDHFKEVNDSHGFPAGDIVLRRVAEVLRAQLRRMDVVARLGGAQFAAILPDTSPDKLVLAMERVRCAIEQLPPLQPPDTGSEAPAHVTLSYGGCSLVAGMVDAEVLLNKADQALREARTHGTNSGRLWIAEAQLPPAHLASTGSSLRA